MMPDNKKQWFLLIFAVAWLFIALALTVSVYIATHDAHMLSISAIAAPPIKMLHQLYHYHFPPSVADYELQKLKIQTKSGQAHNRKRARP